MNELQLIGRNEELFFKDIKKNENFLIKLVSKSKFLIIGGAGSIGQAVVKEIFKRNPKTIHVIDISENNLVELVRDIRSTFYNSDIDFKTFVVDCGSEEFESFYSSYGPYEYVFNLSALKHVRSEKDPFSLMKMIETNIINTLKTLKIVKKRGCEKYFSVSTDKAANPVNLMGGSKKIMEMFLMRESLEQNISMARFANVAFSDGSLLHGINQRILKKQPIAVPTDIERYFITSKESGELCLLSCLLGENRDNFFPKSSEIFKLQNLSSLVESYLYELGYNIEIFDNEIETKKNTKKLILNKTWPCFFFESDTTGEKSFEEFYTADENLDFTKFNSIGIIKNSTYFENEKLDNFLAKINLLKSKKQFVKEEIVNTFFELLPEFNYNDTGKYLDQKM